MALEAVLLSEWRLTLGCPLQVGAAIMVGFAQSVPHWKFHMDLHIADSSCSIANLVWGVGSTTFLTANCDKLPGKKPAAQLPSTGAQSPALLPVGGAHSPFPHLSCLDQAVAKAAADRLWAKVPTCWCPGSLLSCTCCVFMSQSPWGCRSVYFLWTQEIIRGIHASAYPSLLAEELCIQNVPVVALSLTGHWPPGSLLAFQLFAKYVCVAWLRWRPGSDPLRVL